jgi:hypothetical protein
MWSWALPDQVCKDLTTTNDGRLRLDEVLMRQSQIVIISTGDVEKCRAITPRGQSLSSAVSAAAIEGRCPDTLRFFVRIGAEVTKETMYAAARTGSQDMVHCLFWPHYSDLDWREELMRGAARAGHWDLLIWGHGCCCAITPAVLQAAAHHGDKETLKWLMTKSFAVWPQDLLKICAAHGHLEAFQYVLTWGWHYQITRAVCKAAATALNTAVLQWLADRRPHHLTIADAETAVVFGRVAVYKSCGAAQTSPG